MFYDQAEFEIRCEWGESGLVALAGSSDVIIIVDVLSFSTSVDIAVERGAIVVPSLRGDKSEDQYLRSRERYSLSPSSLTNIQCGIRLVLSSPNGATLSLSAKGAIVLAGCLRNAQAVAEYAQQHGRRISVIPAGEKWPDGSFRPAFEDLVGAGAVISFLIGSMSPEAEAATAAFERARSSLRPLLRNCGSGRELIERGFESDVDLAADLNVSRCVPLFVAGTYRATHI